MSVQLSVEVANMHERLCGKWEGMQINDESIG